MHMIVPRHTMIVFTLERDKDAVAVGVVVGVAVDVCVCVRGRRYWRRGRVWRPLAQTRHRAPV